MYQESFNINNNILTSNARLPLASSVNSKEAESKEISETAKKSNQFIGYFYKIKNSDNKTVGAMCGLLHRCSGSLFALSQPINKALLKSDTVYLEHNNPRLVIDERRKIAYKMLQQYDSSILNAAVRKYEEEISTRVNNFGWAAIKTKYAFDQLPVFKKFEMCRKHYEIVMAKELGKRNTELEIQGMDDFIGDISKELKKNTMSLEKQNSALYQEMIDIAIMGAVDFYLHPNFDHEKRQFEIGNQEWLLGKIPVPRRIEDLTSEENQMLWEFTCGRSEQIAATILERLQSGQGRAFYAFGFSHLYNQRNVISSLESHGFKVIRQ